MPTYLITTASGKYRIKTSGSPTDSGVTTPTENKTNPSISENIGETVGGMFGPAGQVVGKWLGRNREAAVESAPATGMAVGGLTGGIPGAAVGGVAGEALRMGNRALMGKPAAGPVSLPIAGELPQIPLVGKPASNLIQQGAIGAALEAPSLAAKGIGKGLESLGISAARRSIGFQKSQMASSKSWAETLRKIAKTNEAAKEALDRGDIPLLGGAAKIQDKAQKMLSEGSAMVKGAIDKAVKSGKVISEGEIDDVLYKALNPKTQDELNVALKIRREVTDAMVGGGLSADSLGKLRQLWGQLGFRDTTVGSVASNLYRNAWKAASSAMKNHLENVSSGLGETFTKGMKREEAANTILNGVSNRIAREEGNYIFTVPGLLTATQTRAMGPAARALYSVGKNTPGIGSGQPQGIMSIIQSYKNRNKK